MIGIPLHELAPDDAPVEDVAERIGLLRQAHTLTPHEVLPVPDDAELPDGQLLHAHELVAKLRRRGAAVQLFIQASTASMWITISEAGKSYYGDITAIVRARAAQEAKEGS